MRPKIAIAGKPGSSDSRAPICSRKSSSIEGRRGNGLRRRNGRQLIRQRSPSRQAIRSSVVNRSRSAVGSGSRAPSQPAPIYPFSELPLGRADFGDQRDRIRDRLQPAQLHRIKLICWRARKMTLSPASRSPDTVHKRKAMLSGSIRNTLQNLSSPNRCCSS